MLYAIKTWLLILLLLNCLTIKAQVEPPPLTNSTTEQQLENLAEAEESETEDDSYLQQYQQFHKHPVNLNTAGESELKSFLFLSPLQIQQFCSIGN